MSTRSITLTEGQANLQKGVKVQPMTAVSGRQEELKDAGLAHRVDGLVSRPAQAFCFGSFRSQ